MKFPVVVTIFSVLLLLLLPRLTCSMLRGNETDHMVLLDFKQACSDPRGSLVSWNASIHFCSWKGVTCSLKHPQRVSSLNLTDQGLVGQISPSLGNLTHLRALRLSTNGFRGEIPASIGRLRRLEVLSLSNNSLQGWIPDELSNCSNLQSLYLISNQLRGEIPHNIGSLSKLSILALSANNLTGNIPLSMGNMTTLRIVSLSKNYLHGNIPQELGKLSGMSYLALGANLLSGIVPPMLFNLSSLSLLGLEFNHLDNAMLPHDFGSHLPNLQHLGLDSNHFEGPIPSSLANASRLIDVGLSSNHFSGSVPSSLGNLQELSFLDLAFNNFGSAKRESWDFMDSLINCSKLQEIVLNDNNLQGVVPNSIGNLSSQLQVLYLGTNRLSGNFPTAISNLQSLAGLSLENNQYTGVIPEWIGNLRNLQALYLEGNNFIGPIPHSIGNLSQLLHLYLQDNRIGGLIPTSLGSMKSLLRLNINNNSLTGNVPAEIFSLPSLTNCQLSFNKLDGMLPPEVGNAKQLIELHLSSNNLSGEIPHTLGDCHGLDIVQLAQNYLVGKIPVSLGRLQSMQVLNLSHNMLSGSIPKSLGGLKLLSQIDLSYNRLVGEVPTKGVFLNASALMLQGNIGLCSSVPELRVPACSTASSDSKRRMPRNMVITIATTAMAVMTLLVILIVVTVLFWKKKLSHASMALPSSGTKFPKVTYKDLVEATGQFSSSNLIGRGRYGCVYKARLHGEPNFVAVKVFDMETRGANRSFIAECEALRSIRHRNLVPILTACSTIDARGNDFKALVYEFMPKGSLDSLLHSKEGGMHAPCYLTLIQRLSIALDIANALEYLHHNSQSPIVHSDMKPSNILLDDDMSARVSDFGLARFCDKANSSSTVVAKGTIGYIAPEYATGRQVMATGDVYSFGIILMETLTGRRPTDDIFREGLSIVSFVEASFPDKILDIVDAQLQEEIEDFKVQRGSSATIMECIQSVLRIGLSCTLQTPNGRMNMREVAIKLQAIRESYVRDGTF